MTKLEDHGVTTNCIKAITTHLSHAYSASVLPVTMLRCAAEMMPMRGWG